MKKGLKIAMVVLQVVIAASIGIRATAQTNIGGVDLGNLPKYLFVFTDGSADANWQGATKGFVGNVAVSGTAGFRTSGGVPYAGTINTNGASIGAWNSIVTQNSAQASASLNQTALMTSLAADFNRALNQINSLVSTAGYNGVNSSILNGLNTQNGIGETFVIHINAGLTVNSKLTVTGDANDVFVIVWDTDNNPANGYQGQVKYQSGGAIVPAGGLKPTNFIHVAGDINSSGGGNNPAAPYPQGPRFNNGTGNLVAGGADFSGGGFFTGYWLTTGNASGATSSLSNGIFVGGWYSSTKQFSMTSGTSGVYVSAPVIAPSGFSKPDINRTTVNKQIPGSVATNDKAPAGMTLSYSNPVAINGADGLPNPSGAMPSLNADGSYTFTATVAGVYSYNVTVCTNTGTCQPQNLTIIVTDDASAQNPPIANTDIAATRAGTAVDIPVLINDYVGNPGGTLGTPGITVNPLHGTAAIVNGQLRYTPATGFAGRDTVVYQVCESPGGLCTKAYAIIDVKPLANIINTTSAADDYNETRIGVAVGGNVKNNDVDAEGNTQSVIPQNITNGYGTFVLDANGKYTYTPAAGFTGTAQFMYTTTDNGSPQASAQATLYVYVSGKVSGFSKPDINRTRVNQLIPGSVATNDKAPAGMTLTYSNPVAIDGADGNPNPSAAMPNLNADGTYTFTAAVAGVYSYNVKVCTNTGVCEQQNLTITVTDDAGTQNPPIANTDIASTRASVPVDIPVLVNDYIGNPGGTLGTPGIATNPLHGTATIVNGLLHYIPNTGFSGRDTVIYQVCESPGGLCTKAYAIIDVKPAGAVNTTSAADDYDQTRIGVAVSGNVKTNDVDAEGNTQSVTPQNITNSYGTFILDANGNYTYAPADGFTGTAQFIYTTTDNGTPQASAQATLYVYVSGRVSGFSNPDVNRTTVNKQIPGSVATNDKAPAGMTLSYSDLVAIDGADGNPNPSGAMPNLNADGSYTFTAAVTGVYSYNVKVCTNTGVCEQQNLTITVTDDAGTQNPPIANTDIASTRADVPVDIPVLVNDYIGNPGGTLGTPGIATDPLHGTATIVNGLLHYIPNTGFSGRDTVIYQVCESPGGLCTKAYAIIDVKPVGAVNTTSAADDYNQTIPGVAVGGNVKDNDVDAEGNTQSVTPQNITNSYGTFVLDANGKYTYTPANGFIGTAQFTYTAIDNGNPQASAQATLYVAVKVNSIPDLVPRIKLNPNNIVGASDIEVTVVVAEIADVMSSGKITLFVDKLAMFGDVSFDNAATSNSANEALSNSVFAFDATSNPDFYIITTDANLKDDLKRVMFKVKANPGAKTGVTQVNVSIKAGSGGDQNNVNNGYSAGFQYFFKTTQP
ncbi:Ig-like domain-containing protein [Niabella sp.]|uniref:beta strand repeat-containing protein n=1 Tax=Niabella sp. TaxID=1962976 RepID=UPI00261A2730|nr:Ig-like domain-containing protein [Niabella sp.]